MRCENIYLSEQDLLGCMQHIYIRKEDGNVCLVTYSLCPGESTTLIRVFLYSTVVTFDVIVIPRSFSRHPESITLSSLTFTAHSRKILSQRVDLPCCKVVSIMSRYFNVANEVRLVSMLNEFRGLARIVQKDVN